MAPSTACTSTFMPPYWKKAKNVIKCFLMILKISQLHYKLRLDNLETNNIIWDRLINKVPQNYPKKHGPKTPGKKSWKINRNSSMEKMAKLHMQVFKTHIMIQLQHCYVWIRDVKGLCFELSSFDGCHELFRWIAVARPKWNAFSRLNFKPFGIRSVLLVTDSELENHIYIKVIKQLMIISAVVKIVHRLTNCLYTAIFESFKKIKSY